MNKKQKNKLIYENKRKSPGTAAVLSLIIVGAGQLYNGDIVKGIIFFILTLMLWSILMGWIMWIIAPIEAYYAANKKNDLLRLELDLD